MKATYKQLKTNSKQLSEAKELLSVTKESVFYKIFSTEENRQADMNVCLQSQKELLNIRHTLLEGMQMAIRRELSKVSHEQKKLKQQLWYLNMEK